MRPDSLDMTAIDELASLAPGIRVRWRTLRTPSGWRAQCSAGFPDYISPVWQVDDATEQAALDRAAHDATWYWSWWRKSAGR